ncbi:glycosyltransferase family 2 protein [Dapis sp. BLCC M229]|uniref:glycosyltransferase family 2 protein n=1 Tax=Dapis sp. BLCC M229 TaxID=3400188 RepID=UPI003CFA5F19
MLIKEENVKLSIVIPCYNEEPNIDYLFERLISVLEPLEMTYEIVCVNDGSKDNTLKLLVEYHQRNHAIKVVNFSRNFGKEIALTAGIDYTVGDAVIPIDADLQDPPELIGELIAKWQEGYDVVYATRRSRQGESWVKKFTAQSFYRIIQGLTAVKIPPDTGDFRLMDRKVVEALKQLPETNRFMKGLFSWVGYQQTSILYDRDPRFKGQTKWNYWKLWNFAIEGITAFSSKPLKIWSYIGVLISLISFIYAGFLVIRTLILGTDVPGYASLIVAILFLGGMQLLSLGILGEYLGRIHNEVKRRPLYLVRESYGFKNQITRGE